MRWLAVVVFVFFLFQNSFAQVNNLRKKTFLHVQDTVIVDSLPLIPESIEINDEGQAIVDYTLVWQKSMVIFHHPVDSVTIVYRVFNFTLNTDTLGFSPHLLPLYSEIEPVPVVPPPSFAKSKLDTKGKISRGIFFGSNQQPSLTSDLNLTVRGNLDNNTQIEATISDNMFNGNDISGTYSLRDFDRTMIKITFSKSVLRFGDMEAKNSYGYFVRFRRAVRGADYFARGDSVQWHVGMGVQKGIFRRMHFMGEEGNQGPYKLIGQEGEQMILIVSGSERVYVNGTLKRRGAQYDYTVNYTTAELTFTANCPITKDSRITVEFEYWAFDYQRYSLWTEMTRNFSRSTAYLGFVQVKDNISAPLWPLNKEQVEVLYNAGDSLSHAVVHSADSVGYEAGKILYCKKDTVVNGETYEIFEYCQDKRAVWEVSFTYAGAGRGDYVQDKMQVNGRIFRWVGKGQGDYLPVARLTMPLRKTVTYGGGRWQTERAAVSYELAVSDYDRNLFSPFDDDDNRVYNLRFGLGRKVITKSGGAEDSVFVRYRLISSRFAQFEPFLPVEFSRDWNLLFDQWSVSHYFMLGNDFKFGSGLRASTRGEYLFYPQVYKGLRFDNTFVYDTSGWDINTWVSYVGSQQQGLGSGFLRTIDRVARHMGKSVMGMDMEAEHNVFRSDTLFDNSYAFVDYKFFYTLGDSGSNFFELRGGQRYDHMYNQGILSPVSVASEASARVQWKRGRFRGQTILNLRSLHDTSGNKQSVIVRSSLHWQLPHWGSIAFLQEAGKGLQRITEFYFVRVPTGQGQYAWIDFNRDGLQQINEFQLTRFADQANYIRVVLPAVQYIPVFSDRRELEFVLLPDLQQQSLVARIISRINNQLNLSYISKNKDLRVSNGQLSDTNVIFYQYQLMDNLIFKMTRKISLNFLLNRLIDKDLLLGGMRLIDNDLRKLSLRYVLCQRQTIVAQIWQQRRLSESQLFATENYLLYSKGLGLSFTQSDIKKQVQAKAEMSLSDEQRSGVYLRHIIAEITFGYILCKNMRINFVSSLIYNALSDSIDQQLSYVLMQGFTKGWNGESMTTLSYRVNKIFTFQADYQIRITGGNVIHNFGFRITGWF